MRRRYRRRCRNKRSGKGWRSLFTRDLEFGAGVRSAPTLNVPDTTLDGKVRKIYDLLPKLDCGSCGYDSCLDMAKAISDSKESPDACVVAGGKIAYKIEKILEGGDA